MIKDDMADRLLPLEGGVNFRDMGGYSAQDGRKVKWRHLYRSGTMSRLTEEDREHLDQRGIRTVIDFRSQTEQVNEPNDWAMTSNAGYWSRQHDEMFGNLATMAKKGIATVRDAEAIMEGGFRQLPFQQAEAYTEMFRRLAGGEVPAVIHCTAGKDRTGGGAALILAALGVPRESIVSDFVMTERAVDLTTALQHRKPGKRYTHFAKIDPEVRRAFSAARPGFITALLDGLEKECGSVENYLSDLGFTPSDLDDVRSHLLE